MLSIIDVTPVILASGPSNESCLVVIIPVALISPVEFIPTPGEYSSSAVPPI